MLPDVCPLSQKDTCLEMQLQTPARNIFISFRNFAMWNLINFRDTPLTFTPTQRLRSCKVSV